MFRIKATEFPLSILIETKSQCQGKCIFCPYNELRRKKSVDILDESIIVRVLEEISRYSVRRISLFCNNEPLLDERIVQIVKEARLLNILSEITLSTNGILLNKLIAEKLYDAGLSILYVSIPTVNEQDYFSLMGTSILPLMKTLNEISTSRSKKMIRIAVPETYVYDEIEMTSFCESYDFPFSSWNLEYKDSWNLLNGFIKRKYSKKSKPCDRAMDQACILANGNVVLCCRDWKEEEVIGNIKEDTLFSIWHSDKMRSLQEDIASQKYQNVVCCDCSENPKHRL